AREGLILTAQDEGLKRWEEIFGLSSSGGVEDRRAAILAWITGTAPFTIRSVKEMLESVCGEGTVRLEYGSGPYSLNVIIQASIINRRALIEKILKRVLPANMEFSIVYDYNKHGTLAGRTHAELASTGTWESTSFRSRASARENQRTRRRSGATLILGAYAPSV
ncbi:MAG: DUF2313 domain-containing protein, partial [Atopobiaceae bacterium]|nr:DUF2313 domain-containing protein [Atopobiaceae bacterium]